MDWTVFDLLGEFTFTEAAYLWLEKEPVYTTPHPAKVIALSNALYAAYKRGELEARNTSYYHEHEGTWRTYRTYVYGDLKVERQHLMRWAAQRGQYPAFLFPEHRESVSASCSATVADWRAEALAAVGANIQKPNADAASSAVEKADALAHPEALPIEPAAPAPPAQRGRTRVVRIRKAVEAADAVLTARLHRAPEAREVFDYLAEHDETEAVVDHKPDTLTLTWEDSNGKLHDQTYKAMSNMLSDIRRGR